VNDLGTVLINLRKRAGLSQSDLAKRAKLSGGYLSQLETGVRGDRVPLATLERLARALGVDRKVLLDAAQYGITNDHNGTPYRPALETFIETEPTLDSEQKSFLLNLIAYFRANSQEESPSPRSKRIRPRQGRLEPR
jgi:transcriptional regulator with XRE-family HTH domain